MLSINTNVSQMTALQNMSAAGAALRTTQNALATGQKTASAKTDGASFSMAQNIRGTLASYSALSAANDRTISLLDTTTAGLQSISDLLIQMKKVATEASDQSLDDNARAALDSEYQALMSQIDNIAQSSSFEGQNLIDSTNDPMVYYSVGGAGGTAGLQWSGGGITPQAGDTLNMSVCFDNTGTSKLQLTGTATFRLYYGPSTSNYLSTTTLGATALGAPATLDPSSPTQTFQQTATMPSLPASDNFLFVYADFNGQLTDEDGLTAAVNHGLMLANWTPGVALTPQSIFTNSQTETTSRVEAMNGIDGSQTVLRSTLTGTAGAKGLALDNTDLISSNTTPAAIDAVDRAQTKVQALLQHYSDKAAMFESLQKSQASISATLTSAVGRLTDADMGQESAELTSAQTKQQLALQSLAIANASPQLILSLFQSRN